MLDLSGMRRVLAVDGERTSPSRPASRCTSSGEELARPRARHGEPGRHRPAERWPVRIATATHGTGAALRQPLLAGGGVRLVDRGAARSTSSPTATTCCAARVSLGALGVDQRGDAALRAAFTIHRVDEPRPLDEVLAAPRRARRRARPLRVLRLPLHAPGADAHLRAHRPRAGAAGEGARPFVQDVLLENAALGLACRARARASRARSRALNRRDRGADGPLGAVDASNASTPRRRASASRRWSTRIPREHAAEALERVLDLVERRRLPIGFPIELRVVAPDDALLSTAHGRADRLHRGPPVPRDGVRELLPRRSRRSWTTTAGARTGASATTSRPRRWPQRYPEWDRFAEIRARARPGGAFRERLHAAGARAGRGAQRQP